MACRVILHRDADNVDSLIRKFKKKVQKEGIIAECKKREFFRTKAEKRLAKSKEAQKRRLKHSK